MGGNVQEQVIMCTGETKFLIGNLFGDQIDGKTWNVMSIYTLH
jgi:hypothetical protein